MDVLEATPGAKREFNAAEIGAIAHLYRGEVYRSTVWRTRLDNTTNWAVAGLGVAGCRRWRADPLNVAGGATVSGRF